MMEMDDDIVQIRLVDPEVTFGPKKPEAVPHVKSAQLNLCRLVFGTSGQHRI